MKLRTVLAIVIVAGLTYFGVQTGKTVKRINKLIFRGDSLKALDYLPEAALRIKNFHRVSVKDGRKEWEVWGNEAQFLKDQRQAVLLTPRMTVYPAKGNPISFQSSEGRAFFEGEEVVKINLTGGIDLQQGNLSLQVEEATYDPKTKTISSPGTVTAKGDGLELEGKGMALNLAESKMTLGKDVKTRFYPSRRSESSKRNGKA